MSVSALILVVPPDSLDLLQAFLVADAEESFSGGDVV